MTDYEGMELRDTEMRDTETRDIENRDKDRRCDVEGTQDRPQTRQPN
jgi:hypothetical protein